VRGAAVDPRDDNVEHVGVVACVVVVVSQRVSGWV
jgi:hypothetical protein